MLRKKSWEGLRPSFGVSNDPPRTHFIKAAGAGGAVHGGGRGGVRGGLTGPVGGHHDSSSAHFHFDQQNWQP